MNVTRKEALAAILAASAVSPSALAAPLPDLSQLRRISIERSASLSPAAPAWMNDLILYEIAPRGFTSPAGPESGTFESLRRKLPYLQELGVTGIWLPGYSLSDAHHFFNIWSQYAVIEPDKFDPALGTADEFAALVAAAHEHGIKVLLEAVTHGLIDNSPIIKAHPEWFRGESYRMTDFDWEGGHTDLDDWWVALYTDFILQYGIDGYRIDHNIYRPDLWPRIRRNAHAAGHPIVLFEEHNPATPGVTDFCQEDAWLDDTVLKDLPGYYARKFGRAGTYRVAVTYTDGGTSAGSTAGAGPLNVRLAGLGADKVSRNYGEPRPDGLPDVRLVVEKPAGKIVQAITVRDDVGNVWGSGDAMQVAFDEGPRHLDVFVATLSGGSAIEVSCHDNSGLPNPYGVRGSRATFGYTALFSPMIPIFFAGEEFDAGFYPLPGLSPDIYGGAQPGKGSWLYGNMLDWSELERPEHRDMYDDVRRMIALRREYPNLLGFRPTEKGQPNLRSLQHVANIAIPVPYVRWDSTAAIVAAANRDERHDAEVRLHIPVREMGFADGSFEVTDVWNAGAAKRYTGAALADFRCRVKRDKTARGGLAVFKIEPVARGGNAS